MATLEDKLLGEKLEYYCSSSEDEHNDGIECIDNASSSRNLSNYCPAAESSSYRQKVSTNTGPKGVVQDWQNFKQMIAKKSEESERQQIALAEKLTMTTATSKEDEERKKQEELQKELAELMSEDFLQQFQKQHMAEMLRRSGNITFGKVQNLVTHDEFLDCIEKENKHTTIIIHIYDGGVRSCSMLNKCLDTIATEYTTIKFAKISSSIAGMSRNFRNQGLPAILVYKAQTLIGNFIRLTDNLSDDFFTSDVESFLIENGIIVDEHLYKKNSNLLQ